MHGCDSAFGQLRMISGNLIAQASCRLHSRTCHCFGITCPRQSVQFVLGNQQSRPNQIGGDSSYPVSNQWWKDRISGGNIVDFASDTAVPSKLYPQTGSDVTGQCWYYTSASTQYVILNQYANGDAGIGFDTDPGNPGAIIAIGPTSTLHIRTGGSV